LQCFGDYGLKKILLVLLTHWANKTSGVSNAH